MDEEVARLRGLARLVLLAAGVALVLVVIDLQIKNDVMREAEKLRAEIILARLSRKAVMVHGPGKGSVDPSGGRARNDRVPVVDGDATPHAGTGSDVGGTHGVSGPELARPAERDRGDAV